MGELGSLAHLGVLAGSLSLSLLFVPMALRFALRRDVLHHPGRYEQQEQAIPYLGGMAMLLAFSAGVPQVVVTRR